MRLGASAYLAHAPLAGPNFAAAAEAGATLAFISLHIPEDSPVGARAAATAIVSAAASAGLAVVADVSPNTARLLGDSPWEFLQSIGLARVRIDFGFSVAEIDSIDAVLPIALNANTLRADDLAPFAALDVELIHNFYPREWTGLPCPQSRRPLLSLVPSVGASEPSSSATQRAEGRSARACRPSRSTGTCRRCSRRWRSSIATWTTCTSGAQRVRITRGRGSGRSYARTSLCSMAPPPQACTRRSSRRWRPPTGTAPTLPRP